MLDTSAVVSVAWAAAFAFYVLIRERMADRERAAWTLERQKLLERLTDVPLVERPRPETQRSYGLEADEWAVSERRKARGKTT